MERTWQKFVHTGQFTVGTSTTKAVLAFLGLTLLAALAVGMAIAAFASAGVASWKGWGCAGAAVLVLFGAAFVVVPLFRRRELRVTREGLAVSSRRRGSRSVELSVRWTDV